MDCLVDLLFTDKQYYANLFRENISWFGKLKFPDYFDYLLECWISYKLDV